MSETLPSVPHLDWKRSLEVVEDVPDINLDTTTVETQNEREDEYKALDDDLLDSNTQNLLATDLLGKNLITHDSLGILNEPEIYSDKLEDKIFPANPAAVKAALLVAQTRSEATTHLLRVIRNTVASLSFKGRYDPTDENWELLAQRIFLK